MLSMPWQYLQTLSWRDLETASPPATAISSLITIAIAAVIYTLFRWWRGRSAKKDGFVERFIVFFRSADRALVRYGSWWVGTRVRRRWRRHATMLAIFIVVTAGGVLAPWPWCLWVLSFGLLNVFVVYRHWSHDEDDVKNEVSFENKDIKIQGDLSTEIIGACAFVLVYATTGFAQIQAARHGFQMPSDAGPFAFIWYALVEGVKVAPIVAYYDLFADDLHFHKLGAVAAHSISAKAAVLVFRGALDLIILAALKRFIDIARNVAEGLDLRPVIEVLDSPNPNIDKDAVAEAVGKLAAFATRDGEQQRSNSNASSRTCASTNPGLPLMSASRQRTLLSGTQARV